GSNFAQLTSALGQKQTSVHVRVMPALPPKVDIVSAIGRAGEVAGYLTHAHLSQTRTRMMVMPTNRGAWPWKSKIRFSFRRQNSSRGTKENLPEPGRRCEPNTSGPSGASSCDVQLGHR